MIRKSIPNRSDILGALAGLAEPGQIVELRLLEYQCRGRGSSTVSGYFDDIAALLPNRDPFARSNAPGQSRRRLWLPGLGSEAARRARTMPAAGRSGPASCTLQNPRQPVRSIGNVISLATDCATQFPDTCGIEDALIDPHPLVVEPARKCFKAAIDHLVILGRQVYSIEEMCTVP